MTNERAIELLHRISDSQFDGPHGDERREALSMAVRALSGDGDTISRQQAIDEFWKLEIETRPSWIDAVMNMLNSLPSAQPNVYVSTKDADCISRSQALNAINVGGDLEGAWINAAKLPSAQPERKKGKWFEVDPYMVICPFCKHASSRRNFCAECGADMRGESDV